MHNYFYRWFYLFLLFSLAAFSPPNPAASPSKERSGALIDLADKAFWSMNYPKADSIYTSELSKHDSNAELYWKMARLQVSIGESIEPGKKAEQLHHYRKAAEYARTCITLDSTNSKGHTWLAASLGIMADKIGTKEKLARAQEIKHELDRALQLNPNDETALSILGSYYHEAANIGWFRRMVANTFIGQIPKGNHELAENAFTKAIRIDSRIIRNYHELALIYIEKGNKEEAIRLMKSALDKPILLASDRRRMEEMRTLLKKMSTENESNSESSE
ncbi:MAG: hypothetical protein FDX18_04045 [Chlorobium sp.]|nr:MAG: hypothetical protein FDX18_04045 [Chlorobium sp.]